MTVAPDQDGRPVWVKLAWFVGLWAAGVASVGAVGLVIRFWLKG